MEWVEIIFLIFLGLGGFVLGFTLQFIFQSMLRSKEKNHEYIPPKYNPNMDLEDIKFEQAIFDEAFKTYKGWALGDIIPVINPFAVSRANLHPDSKYQGQDTFTLIAKEFEKLKSEHEPNTPD